MQHPGLANLLSMEMETFSNRFNDRSRGITHHCEPGLDEVVKISLNLATNSVRLSVSISSILRLSRVSQIGIGIHYH